MPTPNLRVCSFESRRTDEMATLIRRRGSEATVVASMQEIPLEENDDALAFGVELLAGEPDVVIFFTGVGAEALLNLLETRHPREEIVAALGNCRVVTRGPKPVPVLRQRGIRIDLRAPEPNTWREVLQVLEEHLNLAGQRIAVQEYGAPNERFHTELKQRGAHVRPVAIYRWALPDDTAPLLEAVRRTIDGRFDLLLFTSAQQIANVLSVAKSAGLKDDWIHAAGKVVVASIGPTTTAALESAGMTTDVEASPTKMGQLVRQAIAAAPEILAAKQSP